jgi:hypothetical protein
MRRRKALSITIAAVLGTLAIAALPVLASATDDHGRHGNDDRLEHERHHGDRHRHNVGRITAFDAGSGQLTIARFGGGTISGMVTSETEIKCEGRDDSAMSSRDHGGSSGPGSGSDDNGGRGEEEPGDDHGNDGQNQTCTTADLTVSTVVHNLDRSFDEGTATFEEIELADAG